MCKYFKKNIFSRRQHVSKLKGNFAPCSSQSVSVHLHFTCCVLMLVYALSLARTPVSLFVVVALSGLLLYASLCLGCTRLFILFMQLDEFALQSSCTHPKKDFKNPFYLFILQMFVFHHLNTAMCISLM